MELNACAENYFSRIDLTCNDMCVCVCVRACVDLLNVFHGMCVYKCTVHECMYVLCTRFHFITMQMYCTCVCAVCVMNMVYRLFT